MLLRHFAVAITFTIAGSNSIKANETALPKPEQVAKLVVHYAYKTVQRRQFDELIALRSGWRIARCRGEGE